MPDTTYCNRLLFAVSLALAGIGCGSQPIPLVAVEGTTVAIALPAGFPTGFGRALYGDAEPPTPAQLTSPPAYAPNSPLEDPQNGEMVFDLYEDGFYKANLPLRYITRVNPSPSTESVITNMMSHQRGQVLAFVDIPMVITEDKWYQIKVTRYRRVVGAPNTFELVSPTPVTSSPQSEDWFGWGNGSTPGVATDPSHIDIFIQQSSPAGPNFTPMRGWDDLAGVGLQFRQGLVRSELKDLVPFPEFELRVPEIGSGQTPPAAWSIEVTYPKYLVRIRGVSLRRASASEAVLHWDAGPDEQVGCFVPGGLLKINVADPKQLTEGVRIAYQLRNFENACALRMDETFFAESPDTFKAWDENGVDVTGSYAFEIDTSFFF